MNRTILIFGLIAGAICSGMLVLFGTSYDPNDPMAFANEWMGFAFLLLGLSITFFGIKSYRDKYPERASFKNCFLAGLGITLVASIMYVLVWEVVYHKYMPDFMDKYSDQMIERAKQSGAVDADRTIEKINRDRDQYKNNMLVRFGYTFLEIFPMGVLVSLISAAVLRRKNIRPAEEEPINTVA